ncbi:MAG: M15 family metallopeptidase [Actinobacteria bacterium]|nr:M15 family metallopeptidase [Actinomycetota bacterium]
MRWRTSILIAALVGSCVPGRVLAMDNAGFPVQGLEPTMSVSTAENLTPQQVSLISAGVTAGGAVPYALKFPTISLTAQTRGGKDVLRLGEGWRIPMATMIVPIGYVRATDGDAMADIVARGQVLMGETAAEVRGAQVGDVLILRDRKFWMHPFTIGAIVADEFVDSGDLLMSSSAAAALGEMPVSRIAITQIVSPASVLAGLKKYGIRIGTVYRLRSSWDRENPDGTLGTATTKKLLGEFSYRPTVGSSILVAGTWTLRNIAWKMRYTDIKLGNNCHKIVAAAIQGALTEIKNSGLSRYIDTRNSNRYGGCFVGRYNRLASKFGAPSRHAWGMAIDINTDTNPQGGVPQMNCDVVRIFRKWGFAWGGNFWPADGMHFEYVGEPRDQLGYPSRYCPNKVPAMAVALPSFGPTTTIPITTTSSTTSSSTSTTSPTTTVAPIT